MEAEFHAGVARGEREFVCSSCGHRQLAEVVGMGEGSATFLNAEGTGQRRARASARKDLEATLAVARCPSCGGRSWAAVARWWAWNALFPVMIFGAVMAALTFAPTYLDLGIDPREQRKLAWAMLGIGAFTLLLMMPLPVYMKWSSVSARVRWKATTPR